MNSRILVVEDESIVALQIEERLAAMGYDLAGRAGSGKQALQIIGQNPPDLILMDIRLKGDMDGISVAHTVRERFHIPVIFLTAYSEEATLERAKIAEPFGYLLKPFEDRELKSAIEIALYKHGAEEEIRRLNRLYDVLSQVNQIIVRTDSRSNLFDDVCHIIVDRGSVDLVWFGQVDQASARIDTVASCGLQSEFLECARFYVDHRPEGQGTPGKAARDSRPSVCNDCGGADCFYPQASAPSSFGLRSCGSFPIHFQGQVFGTLNIGVASAGFFQEREIALLEEVAQDISFALDKIEGDSQREKARAALRESEARYERIVATVPEVIYDYILFPDGSNQFLYVSPRCVDIFEVEAETILQDSNVFWGMIHSDDLDVIHERDRAANQEGVRFSEEFRIVTPSGRLKWIQATSRPSRAVSDSEEPAIWSGFMVDITERKKVEEALRLSENRFRQFFDNIPSYGYMVSPQGTILSANRAALNALGYEESELIGSPIETIYAEESKERIKGVFDRWRATGLVRDEEMVIKTKRGEKRTVILNAAAVRDAKGNIIQSTSTQTDITDRKKAEEDLREGRSRLETVFAAIPDVIVEFDRSLNPVRANVAALSVLGYDSLDFTRDSAVLKMSFRNLGGNVMSAEDLPTSRALRGETVLGEPYLITAADGLERAILAYAAPLYRQDKIQGVVALWHDVTQLRQAEDALRLSEKRLRSLFEASTDSILLADRETGQILDVNPALCQLYGYSRQELLTMKTTDLSAEPEETEAVIRDGVALIPLRFHRKKDGAVFPTEITNGYFTEGNLHLHTAFIRDITERNRTEEALRESEQRFKSLVEGAPEPIFVQTKGCFSYMNPAALELFEAKAPEELLGNEVLTWMTPECREAVRARMDQQIDAGQILPLMEQEYLRRDGSRVSVEVTAVPFMFKGLEASLVFARDITERRQAVQRIEYLKNFFQTIIESFVNGVWVSDENDVISYTNRAMSTIAGIPSEQIVGLNVLTDSAEGTIREFREPYCRAKDTLTPVPYDAIQVSTPAGRSSYQSGWLIPIIRDGVYEGIVCTVEDVTERRKTEQALRDSEQRLQTALAGGRMGMWEWDITTNSASWNDSEYELLGLAPGGVDPTSDLFFNYVHPEDRSHLLAGLAGAAKGEAYWRDEFRIVRADDGQTRWLAGAGQVVREPEARPVRLIGVNYDITDRKLTEEALRQSEEKYRTLIAASPDAIIVTDLSGRITLASQKTCDLLGIGNEMDAVGRAILDWFVVEDQPRAEKGLRDLITQGGAPPVEFTVRKENGTVFDAEVHAAPIKASDGSVQGAIIVARDATDRKNLQAQLLQAQKMEAIGTLAGGIAHDFNNILMALMGYAGLMTMKIPEDHPLRKYVDQIHYCTSKAANLTQSLLAFSRKQTIELKPQSANIIVQDLEKLLRRIIPEDVDLMLTLNQDVMVMADMTQIDQVIINLASNARDAMPKGGRLHIETGEVEIDRGFAQTHGFGKPGKYALISVTDTGIGMDETTQKKIFEPFFTTKEVGKGTGLGLSIAYGIVKQHEGYITVSSEPDKGTTFRIYLPAAKAVAVPQQKTVTQVRGGTETILIAEDNPDLRRIFRDILRTYGYTVLEAENGQDLVVRYMKNQRSVDLVILDVVMPVKNGKEAYDEIRAINPSVKAIFMSGYTGDVLLDKGVYDLGLNYISKPVSADDLLRKVRDILDR